MTTDSTSADEDADRAEISITDKLKELRAGRFAEDSLTSGEIDEVAQQLLDMLKAEATHDGVPS